MIEDIYTYKLHINGKVQGVWFRDWFNNEAKKLKINGYIENLNNKNEVKAIIQGNINSIKKITELSYEGSPMSNVKSITKTKISNNIMFNDFTIK